MAMESFVDIARRAGASDLHVAPDLPLILRVHGELTPAGKALGRDVTDGIARDVVGDQWENLLEQGSVDLSASIGGTRCRINVFLTSRGIGMSVRLLPPAPPTIHNLNLHPDFEEFTQLEHGLVLVCGPTGSGKSSTMAAILNQINHDRSEHIITVEAPIEYAYEPNRCLVRQREVGRDTPSFTQAMIDALREDPDVLMVGEMRDPETMRLTLTAAETGHLVLSTLHSSSTIEALERMVSAFDPEIQAGVRAQIADTIKAVVCQKLVYMPERNMRVPECEILRAPLAVRNLIRQGQFFKITNHLQTGKSEGMWTFERYKEWLGEKTDWETPLLAGSFPAQKRASSEDRSRLSIRKQRGPVAPPAPNAAPEVPPAAPSSGEGVIDLDSDEGNLEDLLSQMKKR